MNERLHNPRALALLMVLALAVFAAGLAHLFLLRFQSGDVLPPYSSLRADPLGAKALYESFEHLAEVRVSRNYLDLAKVEDEKGATLFFLGAPTWYLYLTDRYTVKSLDLFVLAGGRLVMTFLPVTRRPSGEEIEKHQKEVGEEEGGEKESEEEKGKDQGSGEEDEKDEGKAGRKAEEKKDKEEKAGEGDEEGIFGRLLRPVSLGRHWGFDFDYLQDHGAEDRSQAVAEVAGLPESVSWHTALYFKDLGRTWRVIYTQGDRPVIIERRLGRGTIVLAADSFLLSNEALRDEPRPRLLAWMAGPRREGPVRIIFEETHLGMFEQPGLAGLARKYHLHGLLAGLVVLAGLFVWKNSLSLVPASARGVDSATTVFSSERDYHAGLVNLLRRNVPRRKILEVCFEQWQNSSESKRTDYGGAVEKAGEVVRRRDDPVAGYRAVCEILAEGKRKWKKA
ncbi:MAG: DUF4350 domain-containing protein [Thermodesulfobacteriota bacterium]